MRLAKFHQRATTGLVAADDEVAERVDDGREGVPGSGRELGQGRTLDLRHWESVELLGANRPGSTSLLSPPRAPKHLAAGEQHQVGVRPQSALDGDVRPRDRAGFRPTTEPTDDDRGPVGRVARRFRPRASVRRMRPLLANWCPFDSLLMRQRTTRMRKGHPSRGPKFGNGQRLDQLGLATGQCMDVSNATSPPSHVNDADQRPPVAIEKLNIEVMLQVRSLITKAQRRKHTLPCTYSPAPQTGAAKCHLQRHPCFR